jgi:hypothetical protein
MRIASDVVRRGHSRDVRARVFVPDVAEENQAQEAENRGGALMYCVSHVGR